MKWPSRFVLYCCIDFLLLYVVRGQNSLLSTTFDHNSGQGGNMFDIMSFKNIRINEIDIHTRTINEMVTVEIYTKSGTFVGWERSQHKWNLILKNDVQGRGSGLPTHVKLNQQSPIYVASQTRQGIYITLVTCKLCQNMLFTNVNTPVGTVFSQNDDLQIEVGIGMRYKFNRKVDRKVWNGSIHYTIVHDSLLPPSTPAPQVISPPLPVSGNALVTTFQNSFEQAQSGNMFDIISKEKPISIKSMDIHTQLTTPVDVEVYFKGGTYLGYERQATAWVLVTREEVTGKGEGQPTPIPEFSSPASIPSESRVGFYVTLVRCARCQDLLFTTGNGEGLIFTENNVLQITTGKGIRYPFGRKVGNKVWNGVIKYSVLNPPPTPSPTQPPTPSPTLLPTQSPIKLTTPTPTSKPTSKPINQVKVCVDVSGWEDSWGYGCDVYEKEDWCDDWQDCCRNDGFTASQACCICGGGIEEVKPSTPKPVPIIASTSKPTRKPTLSPTRGPTPPTDIPTKFPTKTLTKNPTPSPTEKPYIPPNITVNSGIQWTRNLPGSGVIGGRGLRKGNGLACAANNIQVWTVSDDGVLFIINALNGNIIRRYEHPVPNGYARESYSKVTLYEKSGDLVYGAYFIHLSKVKPSSLGNEDLVTIVVTINGNGSFRWAKTIEGIATGSPLIGVDGERVYVLHNVYDSHDEYRNYKMDGYLSVFNDNGGNVFKEKKVISSKAYGPASLTVVNGQDILYFASGGHFGHANSGNIFQYVQSANSVPKSIRTVQWTSLAAPLVSSNGLKMWIPATLSSIRAWINTNFGGSHTWERAINISARNETTPILAQPISTSDESRIFLPSASTGFYNLNAQTGSTIWREASANIVFMTEARVTKDDTKVYTVQHLKGDILQFDATSASKKLLWEWNCERMEGPFCESSVEADFCLTANDKVVVYGDIFGKIVAVAP